jgi:peptide/nickel transport system substrate-binding protein
LEQLGAQSAALTDPAALKEALGRMQAILAEELPTLVLYHLPFHWIYNRTRFAPMKAWGDLLNGIPFPNNKLAFVPR